MSSQRMSRYVAVIHAYAARVVLLNEAAAARLGLHPSDVKVLRLLGSKAMSAGELIEHTGLTGAAVTALVDRLEAAGYIVRERSLTDRRKIAIRVVPEQVARLDGIYDGLGAKVDTILTRYDEKEFVAVMDYLTRTTQALEETIKELRGVMKVKLPKQATKPQQ